MTAADIPELIQKLNTELHQVNNTRAAAKESGIVITLDVFHQVYFISNITLDVHADLLKVK